MLITETTTRAVELLERAEHLLGERFLDLAWQLFLHAESAGAVGRGTNSTPTSLTLMER